MEEEEGKVRGYLLLLFLVLLSFTSSRALAAEPVITVNKKVMEFTSIPNSTMYSKFSISAYGGDEKVELSIVVVGNLSNWLKFSHVNFTLLPNTSQEISLELRVPNVSAGEYVGKLLITSRGGQINEISLRVRVVEHGGRFKVECFSEKGVIKEFSVLIYSQNQLVESGLASAGVYLSNYLPYGEYKIRVESSGYYGAEKNIFLNKVEQVASFKLVEMEKVKLTIIPRKIVVKFCSGEMGITSLQLINGASYPIPVKINVSSPNIKVEVPNFTLAAASTQEVRLRFNFSEGNYSERIYVEHEGVIDEVVAEISSIPAEECKAEFTFSIRGRDAIKIVENSTSILVIYVSPYEDIKRVRVVSPMVEVYPSIYPLIKSGDSGAFLLRIKGTQNLSVSSDITITSDKGERAFPVKIYRGNVLDKDEIGQEIKELKGLIEDLKAKIADLSLTIEEEEGERIKVISLLLSEFSVKLDVARSTLDTNLSVSKTYVESISLELGNILNDLSKFWGRRENPWVDYLSYLWLLLPICALPILAFIVKRKLT